MWLLSELRRTTNAIATKYKFARMKSYKYNARHY
jgi:hypothetical protein